MNQRTRTKCPVFSNLIQRRMPVGSGTSIGHRMSGVLLAFGIPLSLYELQLSLQNQTDYDQTAGLPRIWAFKDLALLLIWALADRLLDGVRHLLSDIDASSHLPAECTRVWIVNGSALVIALLSMRVLF